jgi:O-antigen ligase
MDQSLEPHSPGDSFSAHAAHITLVAWMVALPFSTAIAEILLGVSLFAALLARRAPASAGSWPLGWRSVVVGGPATRAVPVLWLAFLGWYFASIGFGLDPGAGLESTGKLYRYALFFLPLAVPWRSAQWRVALWGQVLVTAVLLVLSIDALAGGAHRVSTDKLHYNTLAQLVAMYSLFLLAAALFGPADRRRERLAFFVGSLAAAAVIVMTLSRAAVLAWWLGVMALVLFRVPRRVALFAVLFILIAPALAIPTMQSRRADLFDLQHPEFTRRYDMWKMAVNIIRDEPFTGVGPGGFGLVYDEYRTGVLVDDPRRWITSHNDVLTVGVRHGIPAALIWIAISLTGLVAFVRRMWTYSPGRGTWAGAGFAGAGVSLQLFALFGLVHDNYGIYLKINLLLFLWGIFVAADRHLGMTSAGRPDEGHLARPEGPLRSAP